MDERFHLWAFYCAESRIPPDLMALISSINYVSMQSYEFNFCTKLEYRTKHFRKKQRFQSTCSGEQNRHFQGILMSLTQNHQTNI